MKYHNITKDDMNNGDGLRVVLWLSGCSHFCKGCQNPQTWDANSGIEFDQEAEYELFDELNKDYISGITFSGGDPLYEGNLDEVYRLICNIKTFFPNKTIWLYTGYTYEDIKKEHGLRKDILESIDILVDGEFQEELMDIAYPWAGSTNQRVIDVQKSLNDKKVVLKEV